MAQKRFGPTNDAGVVIIESDAEKQIEASAYGSTGYVGILERGPVGELITCTSKKNLLAKTGGYIPESLLPDACLDFWDHNDRAGTLFLIRVTGGNEVKAYLYSFDRKLPRNRVIKWEAHNGGGWGGRRDDAVMDLDAVPTDIQTETTVKLPDAYVVPANKWAGGTIKFSETGDSYSIVSHTAGNGTAGAVVQVALDATMLTDYASGTDVEVILQKDQTDDWGRERKLAVVIKDGETYPSTEWGAEVYVNQSLVASWPNLSSDPNASNYFVKVINEDQSNWFVSVTDEWTGAITAAVRPANDYGVIPTAGVAAKVLTLAKVAVQYSPVDTGASTIADFTFGANVVPDRYTLTYQIGSTDWLVTSEKQEHHTHATADDGVPYVAENSLGIGFTITESGVQDGDQIIVDVLTLRADEAIGGRVYPDVDNAPNTYFRITDNDEETVTIAVGDLTDEGAATDNYRLEYAQEFDHGYDGIADLTSQEFFDEFDHDTSPFNDTVDQGYGIIKLGTPGITQLESDLSWSTGDAAAVQRDGVSYAETKNHQFRYEIPKSITDEALAKDYVNRVNTYATDGLGRSDHCKVCFPSWASVADPVLSGLLKDTPNMGAIHGREAREAKNYSGYHKTPAGTTTTFPNFRDLPTGDTVLNGEILNGAGIQRIVRKKGNYVLWGGRIPYVDASFRFAHHREQLSYYEHVMRENFDYIIFALNDSEEWPGLIAAFKSFFLPEWRNRALQGTKLSEAADIKIDDENNTPLTTAAGDMNADLTLWQADMVERFIITVNKYGVFESQAA